MNVVVLILVLILTLPLPVLAYDDLTVFSDEFDDATSLVRWKSLWQTEGWGADQLLTREINTTQPGRLVLVPHASTWYRDWRGVLERPWTQPDPVYSRNTGSKYDWVSF